MKWVIVALCAANIFLLTWHVGSAKDTPDAIAPIVSEPDLGQRPMVLLRELPPTSPLVARETSTTSAKEPTSTQLDAPPSADTDHIELDEMRQSTGVAAEVLETRCLMSQKFATEPQARRVLDTLPVSDGVTAKLIKTARVRVRHWVLVKAGKEFESAQLISKRMEQFGIEESWIPSAENGEFVVSAGLFRDKGAADLLHKRLTEVGFDPEIVPKESMVDGYAIRLALPMINAESFVNDARIAGVELIPCDGGTDSLGDRFR